MKLIQLQLNSHSWRAHFDEPQLTAQEVAHTVHGHSTLCEHSAESRHQTEQICLERCSLKPLLLLLRNSLEGKQVDRVNWHRNDGNEFNLAGKGAGHLLLDSPGCLLERLPFCGQGQGTDEGLTVRRAGQGRSPFVKRLLSFAFSASKIAC